VRSILRKTVRNNRKRPHRNHIYLPILQYRDSWRGPRSTFFLSDTFHDLQQQQQQQPK